MSALDDVLDNAETCENCYEREAEARAELELLRDTQNAALELLDVLRMRLGEHCHGCGFSGGEGAMREELHNDKCCVARILRTDPDRAKKLGLGWAL